MADSKEETRSIKRQKLNKIHEKQENRREPKVVKHVDWITARKALLEKEKELSRHIDEVIKARQELPWELVEKEYVFQSPDGKVKLTDLCTAEKPELFVYHLMFDPAEDSPCPTCCFFVDGFNGYYPHLISRCNVIVSAKAQIEKLSALRKAKKWGFPVLSAHDSTFNVDFGVERTEEQKAKKLPLDTYNYGNPGFVCNQMPGLSVFVKKDGAIFHTYSAYSRGLDIVNAGHSMLDMLPFGRDGFTSSGYKGPAIELEGSK